MMNKTLLKYKRSNSHRNFDNRDNLLKSRCSTRDCTRAEYGLFSSNRSQHEAVGFIVIVVIIIVIGIIFLGINLRKSGVKVNEDIQVINFLTASSAYTTDCFGDYFPKTLDNLKEDCYNGRNNVCNVNNEDVNICSYLNETYAGLLDKAWPISNGSLITYYNLKVYYSINDASGRPAATPIISVGRGNSSNCAETRIGKDIIPLSTPYGAGYGGNIVSELKICQNAA